MKKVRKIQSIAGEPLKLQSKMTINGIKQWATLYCPFTHSMDRYCGEWCALYDEDLISDHPGKLLALCQGKIIIGEIVEE